MEIKVNLRTSEDQGTTVHSHGKFFKDGVIPAGTYRVDEADGHDHAFTLEEDVSPDGEEVSVKTTANGAGPHEHRLVVRAIERERQPETEGEEETAGADHDAEEARRHDHDKDKSAELGVLETKSVGGHVVECKQAVVNGVSVGIIEGYIAAWSIDTGGNFGVPDQFVRGAFLESLQEHRDRGNRQIRLKDLHGRVIGGFPIETAREDDVGLFAVGHINLDTELGRGAFSLARQGVLTDLSIGFTALDDLIEGGLRRIFKAIVWEGSIVDEPANRDASILEVKAVVPFKDHPLADRDRDWDASVAVARVRAATGSEDAPSPSYRNAFVWFDRADPDSFGSYKLPITDVVGGRLTAVPRAIFAAAAVVLGARGGVDVPSEDRAGIIRHLERYYAKMDLESPFDREERRFMGIDEVKALGEQELETALRRGVVFSKGAARFLSSTPRVSDLDELGYVSPVISRILAMLNECKQITRSGRVHRS